MAFSGASLADLNTVSPVPGRLVINPTDLSAAFPYGGTYVGRLSAGYGLHVDPQVLQLQSTEEQDSRPYEEIYIGLGSVVGYGELSEVNANTLQLAFPGMTVAVGGSAHRKLQLPGSLVSGTVLSSTEAVTALFVPNDTTLPFAILLRKVVPFIELPAPLAFGADAPITLPVTFIPYDDATAADAERVGAVGTLASFSIGSAAWLDGLVPGASFIFAPESLMWQDEARTTLAVADGDPVRAVQDARGLALYVYADDTDEPLTLRITAGGIRYLEQSGAAKLVGDIAGLSGYPQEWLCVVPGNNTGSDYVAAVTSADGADGFIVASLLNLLRGIVRVAGADGSTSDRCNVAAAQGSVHVAHVSFPKATLRDAATAVAEATPAITSRTPAQTLSRVWLLGLPTADSVSHALYAIAFYGFTLGSAQRAQNLAACQARFAEVL